MDFLTELFTQTLGKYISGELVIFIISLFPLLELRGGLIAASLLQIPITTAIPICILGNIVPIPFILFFIRKIFAWMKRFKFFYPLIDKLEKRAMNRSNAVSNGEFIGLMLFVGIPLPGTGAWTGSLIASLLEIDVKKAVAAELAGIIIATVIMSILSYGLLDILLN
ncbi:MAG: small multi-drug export protein [Bacteroides sp.]|nr:small multi-drug export protein [Prevotella sp.]MCM1408766.1 small multi-drug export protein [Treponema brennaborense]MCM1470681.1 small multi-drug export protein [Bacteroides sp.]